MKSYESMGIIGPEVAFTGMRADTMLLQAVLDNMAEGVLIVDAEGSILITNQRFHELWRLPPELRHTGDDVALLAHLSSQVVDARTMVADLLQPAQIIADRQDWVHCLDGRIVERVCRPLPGSRRGGRLWFFRDVTEQKRLERTLSDMAYHDALTGLPNRKLLADRLDQALAHATRAGVGVAVCYADLDGFKRVNDQYGHACGDRLLVEIGRRFSGALRADDTVARTGGDEFILVLSSLTDPDEAIPVLERLLEVSREPLVLSDTVQARVTVSLGVSLFPRDSSNPGDLVLQADSALYHAKLAGKNCYRHF